MAYGEGIGIKRIEHKLIYKESNKPSLKERHEELINFTPI